MLPSHLLTAAILYCCSTASLLHQSSSSRCHLPVSAVFHLSAMHSVESPMSDAQSAGWASEELCWDDDALSFASSSPAFFVANKPSALHSPPPHNFPSFASTPVANQLRSVAAAASPLPALETPSISSLSSTRSVASSAGPERVRVAHREIDARRRRKEAGCISQLQALLGLAPVEARLSVLQASVERIERLEAAVQELTAACKERDQRVQVLATHLQQLTSVMTASAQTPQVAEAEAEESSSTALTVAPAFSSSSASSFFPLSAGAVEYLRYLEEQRDLQSSYFSTAKVCMMMFDCHTYRMVDANSTFFAISGWTPAEILHRRCSLPANALDELSMSKAEGEKGAGRYFLHSEDSDRPLLRQRKQDGSTALVPLPYMRQYPSTVRLLREMLDGKITSYRSRWRCVWADSNAYESDTMALVAKTEWVEEPDGRRWEKPTHSLVVASLEGTIRLDIPAF